MRWPIHRRSAHEKFQRRAGFFQLLFFARQGIVDNHHIFTVLRLCYTNQWYAHDDNAEAKKMTNKIFIFILVWSLTLAAWVWANPPAGTPGTTNGALIADSMGNIDIGNNASSANTTAKNTRFTFRGRDTINAAKLVGQIIAIPQDANWIDGSLGFYTRTANENPTEKVRISHTGYIGIGTTAPVAPIDLQTTGTGAGAVVIRNGFLNMNNNTIKNLPMPVNADEAVNKAYVDAQSGGSNPTKIWGQGRPGTAVLNTAGECVANSIKISRSTRTAEWGNAAAACPAGWWVCSAVERDINGSAAGYGVCGTASRNMIACDTDQTRGGITVIDEFYNDETYRAWLSNAGSTDNNNFGLLAGTTGDALNEYQCSMMPVWCCALRP